MARLRVALIILGIVAVLVALVEFRVRTGRRAFLDACAAEGDTAARCEERANGSYHY